MITWLMLTAMVWCPFSCDESEHIQEQSSEAVTEKAEDVPAVPTYTGIRRTPPQVPSGNGTTATLYTINAPPPGFDGRSRPMSRAVRGLMEWKNNQGASTDWVIDPEGFVHASDQPMRTSRSFSDLQLHLEFSLPTTPGRIGSDASSFGVLLQGRYEILLRNSFGRPPTRECSGALRGMHPPSANAMLPAPGWQTLDVFFSAAQFENDEMVVAPRMTAMINGILVLNNVEISEPSPEAFEKGMPKEGPLVLRGSKDPVILRNIWIRTP